MASALRGRLRRLASAPAAALEEAINLAGDDRRPHRDRRSVTSRRATARSDAAHREEVRKFGERVTAPRNRARQGGRVSTPPWPCRRAACRCADCRWPRSTTRGRSSSALTARARSTARSSARPRTSCSRCRSVRCWSSRSARTSPSRYRRAAAPGSTGVLRLVRRISAIRSARRCCQITSADRHDGDQEEDRRQHVDLDRDPAERDAEDVEREGHGGPGVEVRDHEVVDREREGEQPGGGHAGRDQRQRDQCGTSSTGDAPRSARRLLESSGRSRSAASARRPRRTRSRT